VWCPAQKYHGHCSLSQHPKLDHVHNTSIETTKLKHWTGLQLFLDLNRCLTTEGDLEFVTIDFLKCRVKGTQFINRKLYHRNNTFKSILFGETISYLEKTIRLMRLNQSHSKLFNQSPFLYHKHFFIVTSFVILCYFMYYDRPFQIYAGINKFLEVLYKGHICPSVHKW